MFTQNIEVSPHAAFVVTDKVTKGVYNRKVSSEISFLNY